MSYILAGLIGFIAGGIVMGLYANSIKTELKGLRDRIASDTRSAISDVKAKSNLL